MSYPGVEFDAEAWQLLSPADYVNPEPQNAYHLVVDGAGPAGLISAIGAAGLGASVELNRKYKSGVGVCFGRAPVGVNALYIVADSYSLLLCSPPHIRFNATGRLLREQSG